MKQTKMGSAAALLALGVMSDVQASGSTQSLDSIRRVAQVFVQSQVPGEPNTIQVAVAPLDAQLQLAACGVPLRASLAAGAKFRPQTLVAVSCQSGTPWTVYVPVSIKTIFSILV